MIAQITCLIAESSWNAVLPSSRTLGIGLWIGLAILSVALLILMRTRWGQAQPLSKCIVLSVFAHLLLFVYAYGTRLFEEQPAGRGDQPIQLAFVAPQDRAQENRAQEESKPWDELVSEQAVETEAAEVTRAEVGTADVSRPAVANDWAGTSDSMPRDRVPDTVPNRPSAAPKVPLPARSSRSPVTAAVMEPLPSKPEPRQTPVMPDPDRYVPDRIQTTPSARRVVDQGAEDRLPSQLTDIGSRMQMLADVEPRSETGDSLPGQLDQLAQSENRGTSSIESTGIVQQRSATESADFKPLVAIPNAAMSMVHSPNTVPASVPMMIEQVVAAVPRRLGDGQPLPARYRLRNRPERDAVAVALGGGTRAAAAVDGGLAWMAAQQESDGRWDPGRWGAGIETKVDGEDRGGAGMNADTGITGLAILAFLANGQTHLEGIYRKNVQRGLEYLLQSQVANGSLAGNARFCAQMYCHGMASLALSESLALTGDVRIRPYVQRAVDYSVAAQHKTSGGWRYQPGGEGDMSQFGWQVMALKSAEMAGIVIPDRTHEGMLHFLGLCQKGTHGGLTGYRPSRPASRPMTAESLVCRYFIELTPAAAQVTEASDYLLGELPQDAGTPNYYYWYYATLAMFQVQGDAWEQWNQAMQHQLIRRQRTDGHLAGSWNPDTVWGSYGGRVYSTAMATLCLEVYYRYLPLTTLSSPVAP